MTPESRHAIEYTALRATIRERGTARLVLAPVVFIAWAGVAIAAAAAVILPFATLLPLVILAAGFEAIVALHANVERIGRYLQVFHEGDGGWEHVAMAFGRRFPGGGPDPLFVRLFLAAVAINYLPAAVVGTPIELAVLGFIHLLALLRIVAARRAAAGQRAVDLERFTSLRGSGS